MQSLPWYINRLGRMSAAEVAWRAGKAARTVVDRLSDRLPIGQGLPLRLQLPATQGVIFIHPPQEVDIAAYEKRVERIMTAGRYPLFHLSSCQLGSPPDWNRDPLSGTLAPLAPASALDYRNESLVGNIKYLWEPNRHLHLVQLAQAHVLSAREDYAREIERQLDSWIAQCPVGRGPNWASSLELGIRLINWSLTWQLLGGERSFLFVGPRGRFFRERWLRSVQAHVRAIHRHYSRFSSANNHLIGEAAGVWIAALTWPELPRMREWRARARRILEAQIVKQNAADGGNREQAFSYQQFVADFFLLAGLAGRAAGEDFSAAYWARLEKMIGFLAGMMDVNGNVPMVGDADDGYVVSLSAEPGFCPYRSLVATGAVLFGREEWKKKALGMDDKTRWLMGAGSRAKLSTVSDGDCQKLWITLPDSRRCADVKAHEEKEQRTFIESGYYLLGDRFGTEEEVRMLVDAGPLGYLSLAAHGHADALAVVLNVGGQQVLIDPGTYAYHTRPEWRRYFRGTAAHNTVLVDGVDQSRQSGNFMWSRHARARCLEFSVAEGRQRFVGEHDGYAALEDAVMHRRAIDYDEGTRTFEIEDVLTCAASHTVARRWHFSETLGPVVAEDGSVEVLVGPFVVRLIPLEPLARVAVVRGGSATEGGWVSRRFGLKTPCTTVEWGSEISGPTSLRARVQVLRV